jgi:hypothetical protein
MDDIRQIDERDIDMGFDWRSLVNPASAYSHPSEVVADPKLTTQEKRAILSSWASDVCAVDDAPGLRLAPGATNAVLFDDIIDALHSLDGDPLDPDPGPRPGGKSARRPWFMRSEGSGDTEGGLPQAA